METDRESYTKSQRERERERERKRERMSKKIVLISKNVMIKKHD